MKKNDIVETPSGTFRILSLEKEKVLAINCEKKTMPQFFPLSFFENGNILEGLPSAFPSFDELTPINRTIAQKNLLERNYLQNQIYIVISPLGSSERIIVVIVTYAKHMIFRQIITPYFVYCRFDLV